MSNIEIVSIYSIFFLRGMFELKVDKNRSFVINYVTIIYHAFWSVNHNYARLTPQKIINSKL